MVMRTLLSALLVALALSLAAGRARAADDVEPGPLLLDRVVAVVGDRLILSSDVALERALTDRDPRPSPIGQPGRSPLLVLIDASIIRGLAGDVTIYQPSAADVRERLATLRATWENPGDYIRFLATYGLDEDRLSGVLFARIVVERYLQRAVVLPSQTAGEDAAGLRSRYDAWIRASRAGVPIRIVHPWSSEDQAFPLQKSDLPGRDDP